MHVFQAQAAGTRNGDALDFRYLARTMRVREAIEANLGVPVAEVNGNWARFKSCMQNN